MIESPWRAFAEANGAARRLATCLALSAAAFGGQPARADAPATGVLSIRVVGLRSGSGQVGCTLYGSEKGFPKDPDSALQKEWCPIAGAESMCRFSPVVAGTYAVACFHDENKNGKLDTGLFGIPTEGTVVSNHAKGFLGPPSFKDAKFSFAGTATELRLKMGY